VPKSERKAAEKSAAFLVAAFAETITEHGV